MNLEIPFNIRVPLTILSIARGDHWRTAWQSSTYVPRPQGLLAGVRTYQTSMSVIPLIREVLAGKNPEGSAIWQAYKEQRSISVDDLEPRLSKDEHEQLDRWLKYNNKPERFLSPMLAKIHKAAKPDLPMQYLELGVSALHSFADYEKLQKRFPLPDAKVVAANVEKKFEAFKIFQQLGIGADNLTGKLKLAYPETPAGFEARLFTDQAAKRRLVKAVVSDF